MNYPPGSGFMLVCATYTLLAGFLTWGLSPPTLDRLWEMEQAIKAGQRSHFNQQDQRFFSQGMQQHPNLIPTWLEGEKTGIMSPHQEGWIRGGAAILLRSHASQSWNSLQIQTEQNHGSIKITMQGQSGMTGDWNWQKTINVNRHQIYAMALPTPPPQGELIQLQFQPETVRVHLAFQKAGSP